MEFAASVLILVLVAISALMVYVVAAMMVAMWRSSGPHWGDDLMLRNSIANRFVGLDTKRAPKEAARVEQLLRSKGTAREAEDAMKDLVRAIDNAREADQRRWKIEVENMKTESERLERERTEEDWRRRVESERAREKAEAQKASDVREHDQQARKEEAERKREESQRARTKAEEQRVSSEPSSDSYDPGDPAGYYAVLGVRKTATAAEIRTAYRTKMQEYHPDLFEHEDHRWIRDQALEMTRRVNEAWEYLSDPEKRTNYGRL